MYLTVQLISARSERRNFFRAGRLKNKSWTSTVVPFGKAISSTRMTSSPSLSTSVPFSSFPSEVFKTILATEEMLGRASPLKPRVAIRLRSFTLEILLVECLSKLRSASSRLIPWPLSSISSAPEAPASREFSTSSLTAENGLSITSPAAIFCATSGGRRTILFMSSHLSFILSGAR